MDDRRRDIALFRYSLIREAADPQLTHAERGELVRGLAARDHIGPDGQRVRVSRATLDRWIRAWRDGGFHALVPDPRVGVPTTPEHILDVAVALKHEEPRRTAAHITEVLATQGWSVHPRTVQRHFARLGLNRRPSPAGRRVWSRFEKERPNELWTGDAMHGRFLIRNRKPVLFAFIDDHSRLVPGWRWGLVEDTVRLEAAFRRGLESRGVPEGVYVDNGSPFVSRQLERACASLRIRLIHSTPGEPAGRGKIERFFRTVRDQFEIEVAVAGIDDLAELNRLFGGWLEHVYHRRLHSETGMSPLQRFEAVGAVAIPTAAELHEAFLWSERRQVTKVATISLHGNVFEVDAALVGRRVEVVFDPFDLTTVEIRYEGRAMGPGVVHRVARHAHPQARPEEPPEPVAPTGIDYLRVVADAHETRTRRHISYADMPEGEHDNNEENQ